MINSLFDHREELESMSIAVEDGIEPTNVWGLPLAPLTMSQALERIDRMIHSGQSHYVVTANVFYAQLCEEDASLREVNAGASLVVADGMPLVWASRLQKRRLPERVTGADLFPALCGLAASKGYRVYILGGAPGVGETAVDRLKERFPGLEVVGIESPPFRALTAEEEAAQIERIRAARPHLLFISFSMPRGERWLAKHMQTLGVPVGMNVGAALDFMAGRVPRAPRWIQRIGMEWAYRLYQEPRRLVARYAANGNFMLRMLGRDLGARRHQRNGSQPMKSISKVANGERSAAERDRPLRVLVIAEACNPQWTSVPLVGYSVARALAEHPGLEVTVVTQIRNRKALEADPLSRLARVVFVDNEWVARPLSTLSTILRRGNDLSWTTDMAMGWPSYMVFEQEVFRKLRREFDEGAFDLIHRVTPLSPTMGSPLASMVDVPMIVGPLNGGLPWPKDYPELRAKEREWLVPLRAAYKCLPYYRSTYGHLAGVISGSKHTATEVPNAFSGRRFYLPENGIDESRLPIAADWPEPQGRFRFLTVGRLVPYKGVDLILEAMRSSSVLSNCELRVVGDGPHRAHLENLTREYGLATNVIFTGWIAHGMMAQEFSSAQVFVFPSLREFGGGVVVEAMASALPSIVVNYGGPSELVTSESGVLLPLLPRPELVQHLRQAMEQMAGDFQRCRTLGREAAKRVRAEFTWPAKATRLVDFYHQVV
jgi:exopolysaccharide biosynthesis WecB/TagA/CpsF family protein